MEIKLTQKVQRVKDLLEEKGGVEWTPLSGTKIFVGAGILNKAVAEVLHPLIDPLFQRNHNNKSKKDELEKAIVTDQWIQENGDPIRITCQCGVSNSQLRINTVLERGIDLPSIFFLNTAHSMNGLDRCDQRKLFDLIHTDVYKKIRRLTSINGEEMATQTIISTTEKMVANVMAHMVAFFDGVSFSRTAYPDIVTAENILMGYPHLIDVCYKIALEKSSLSCATPVHLALVTTIAHSYDAEKAMAFCDGILNAAHEADGPISHYFEYWFNRLMNGRCKTKKDPTVVKLASLIKVWNAFVTDIEPFSYGYRPANRAQKDRSGKVIRKASGERYPLIEPVEFFDYDEHGRPNEIPV
jgi:hypothetical protein